MGLYLVQIDFSDCRWRSFIFVRKEVASIAKVKKIHPNTVQSIRFHLR